MTTNSEDESLEIFDKPFHQVIDDMVRKTDPKASREMHREGLGKVIDVAILLRRGFQQSWQFLVVVQAFFIFFGLAPEVSEALAMFGINISGYWIGVTAVVAVVFFLGFGLVLMLYGGSERSNYQVMMKNNPAQRMNYFFYREMAKWAKNMDKRVERLEKKNEKELILKMFIGGAE